MAKKVKVFGAALDPSDSETKIAIKQAHLNALAMHISPKTKFIDPYDAFIKESKVLTKPLFDKIGRFPIESWLTPKPQLEDALFLNPLDFKVFLNSNGCKEYMIDLEKFVIEKVLPDIPLMIGADHSLTGGVLRALSKKYGAENITIIIFDGHFDAIPTDLRLELAKYSKDHKDELQVVFPEMVDSIDMYTRIPLSYNCGTFLNHLLEDGSIVPQNLILYGCMDYPNDEMRKIYDPRVKNYVDFYLSYEEKGVQIIPNYKNNTKMNQHFKEVLNAINSPYLYLSIDVDIASLNAVLAARFMEFIGVDEECLKTAANLLSSLFSNQKIKLIGLDLMEIETYYLNAVLKSGKTDKTIEIMDYLLNQLFKI